MRLCRTTKDIRRETKLLNNFRVDRLARIDQAIIRFEQLTRVVNAARIESGLAAMAPTDFGDLFLSALPQHYQRKIKENNDTTLFDAAGITTLAQRIQEAADAATPTPITTFRGIGHHNDSGEDEEQDAVQNRSRNNKKRRTDTAEGVLSI